MLKTKTKSIIILKYQNKRKNKTIDYYDCNTKSLLKIKIKY